MAAIGDGYIPGSVQLNGRIHTRLAHSIWALPGVKPAGNSITNFNPHTSVETIKIGTRGGDGG